MPDRVPALTGVRDVVASWVVLFHGRALLDRVGILPGLASSRLAASGYLAVDLFFILSGFILARSHAKRLDKVSFGAFAGMFYLNRAFRVLPLNTSASAYC